jgi:hypothetical protein
MKTHSYDFTKADARRFDRNKLHRSVKSPTTIEGNLVVIHRNHGAGHRMYEIERSRIPSKEALLQWVRQLAKKSWMDGESLADFMDKAAGAQNLNIWSPDF